MIQDARIIGKSVNPETYHTREKRRGEPGFVMSASELRIFAQCPARFLAGYYPPDSDAKDFGALLDCLALTPDQFDKRYVVQPSTYTNEKGETKDWNGNANVCKTWKEEQIGKEIIKIYDLKSSQEAVAAFRRDDVLRAWFDACDRQVWVAGAWKDEETGLLVPLCALLDFVPRPDTEFAQCAGDLKTTRNAALMAWQRFCYQMGYHIQAAFYLDLLAAATGEDRNTFCFILQENYAPWQTAKRVLAQDFLELGRGAYQRSLANYCQCLKNNHWPDYDDHDESVQSWSLVRPEPWMQNAEAFAPHFDFGEKQSESAPESESDEVVP